MFVGRIRTSCFNLTAVIAFNIAVFTIVLIYVFSCRTPRNTTLGINLRLFGMFMSALLSTLFLKSAGFITEKELTPSIEYSIPLFLETMVIPLGITLMLFTGPLADRVLSRTLFTAPTHYQIKEKFRSYIIGPIIEEYLYRFLLTSLLIKCYSVESTILITAILFSLSHTHHHYMALLRSGSCDWSELGVHSLSTFLFGLYSGLLFVRTKSIVCLSLIHAFCNWMSVVRYSRLWTKIYKLFATLIGLISGFTLLYIFTKDYTQYRALIYYG
ncbi:CAAX prenyl protease 2 [Tetranychus urticae]|uniref:CAAX prenyl protease 2 n=1 Tax=Tetranychus urticae TaxID=32264 RepID=T1KK03_TETUR|nr:CAAX prenyl protease 2 [Tetranychus urticae]